MTYIPDAYDQWKAHEAEQQAQLDELPMCCECGERIQQEDAVCINDNYICDHCLDDLRVELLRGDAYGD